MSLLRGGRAAPSPVPTGVGAGRPAASPAGNEYYALTWLDVRYDTDVLLARSVARQVGGELGLDSGDQTRIATAVSEVARNALMYAHGGRVEFVVEEEHGAQWLAIYVRDDGPGIVDLEGILAGRFRSKTGYGVGLAGAGRLIDALHVDTAPGRGTVVRLGKRLPERARRSRAACAAIAASLGGAAARNPLEELTRQNRELMSTLDDLAAKSAQLTTANGELEAFAYTVSHDLRAPLRSIESFSRALLEEYGGRLDEAGLDYVLRVRAAVERMDRLIEGILALSRISRASVRYERVDLSALARSAARSAAERYAGRVFEFNIQEGLTAVGDATLLGIALDNLFDNACKYTARRPVAHIAFGARTGPGPQDGETFFVRDNGVGFDSRKADRLFQAFERLHPADEFEGTGIGLATVQRIVQRHSGRIWAEARPGQGATFYLTLAHAGDSA